ncbi:micrococcal nuclease [Thermoanaerobacter thermohydrosulfuricus]|nr:micrococcal nuclease [Thermoanaerobacter thermohydrosulfuricus]
MLKRKLLIFLLTIILLFSLVSCTSPQDAHQKDTYQAQVSTQTRSNEKESSNVIEKPEQDQISQLTNNNQTAKKEEPEDKTEINLIKAKVTKVVDGDTVYVRFENGREEKVRFIGVDTPESTTKIEPYGKEAVAYTKSKLYGKDIWLELDVQERDKYGRLLTYIWLSPPVKESNTEIKNKMFNAILLLEGYAQIMTVPPNIKYVDYFRTYQQEAREQNKGLWGLEINKGGNSQAAGEPEYYIGNRNSKIFHRPDCQWAKKIAPQNKVIFESREEAIKAGYRPCKVCRP